MIRNAANKMTNPIDPFTDHFLSFIEISERNGSTRPVPLPEVFVTTQPDPVPKSKITTRQSLVLMHLAKASDF